MTASERLLAAIETMIARFSAMSAPEIVVNALLTLAVVAGGLVVSGLLRRMVSYWTRRAPGPPTAEKKVRATRVARFAVRLARIGAIGLVVVLVGKIWGLDFTAFLSRGLGEQALKTGLRVSILLFVAVAAFEASGFLIGHAMQRLAARAQDPRRAAQLNTLGPLLRGVAQTAVLLVVGLTLLGEVGVQIGPLLAGAGVLGIALGFGAQTIVKDLLTGVFLLVEDIVSVGDVVRINGSGGVVEEMTLRTIRLRDFDGTLHVFPYGEAQVVHNLTKTFSYYVFDLQISYDSDVDHALEIMRRVGAEMQADPQYAGRILEPIEVVGVDGLGDRGVTLKARVKTRPIEQWNVGREYNRRIKLAFEREGVVIPYPHMKLVLPEGVAAAAPA